MKREETAGGLPSIGKPPDDPYFCMSCLAETELWSQTNVQNGVDESHVLELPAESHFSAKEVTKEFRGLNSSVLGLDGLSNAIIFPILSIIARAVEMFFYVLLRFSVSPSEFNIVALALICKKGASKFDLNNFRAVNVLSFFYKWLTRCIRSLILPSVADNISQQQRGFTDGRRCAQALLALLNAVQRETRNVKRTCSRVSLIFAKRFRGYGIQSDSYSVRV